MRRGGNRTSRGRVGLGPYGRLMVRVDRSSCLKGRSRGGRVRRRTRRQAHRPRAAPGRVPQARGDPPWLGSRGRPPRQRENTVARGPTPRTTGGRSRDPGPSRGSGGVWRSRRVAGGVPPIGLPLRSISSGGPTLSLTSASSLRRLASGRRTGRTPAPVLPRVRWGRRPPRRPPATLTFLPGHGT